MSENSEPSGESSSGLVEPVNLRCEYLENPLGIDAPRPRFSWQLSSPKRGEGQTAYRLIVAESRETLASGEGDAWDSGKVPSDESVNVAWAGPALRSGKQYWWAVRCWDFEGRAGPFSQPASFEMALLEDADWQGRWIGADEKISAPLFRKVFRADRPVARARVYIAGLGYYELSLNGSRVGDHVLDPNWTDYDRREMRDLLYPFDDDSIKRVHYVTYDVTDAVAEGENVIGVMLGNGWHRQRERITEGKMWYGPPRLLMQVNILYADGTRAGVVSDESWRCSSGPITFNNLFYGEVYDARLEQEGWDTPGFDDGKWAGACIAPQPAGKLCAQASPADKVMGRVKPVSVTEPAPGTYVFDLGQTFSGWARLRVCGPAGTKVLLRFAGEVKPDGMLDFRSAGGKQIQSDTYILKGQGEEEYVPRFTWHCFRYVEVTGYPGPAGLDAIQGQIVHSAVSPVGEFKCSNLLINRIQEIFRRTQLANYHGCVPSDCPHRERLGYTGDGHLTTEAAMLNFSVPQLYTKWLRDIGNAQNQHTGFVPHTAPFYGGGGGPAWGSAYVIVSWLMYLYYADTRALEEHWAGLERWMEYLAGRCDEGGIVVREEPDSWCLGDWSLPGDGIEEPPHKRLLPALVNTFYYGYCAQLMGRIAKALGQGADAERYRELEKQIAEAFHRRFFDAERGCYSIGHFGTDAFGLALGAPPPDQEPRVLDSLLRTIEKNNGHLDTGILGTAVLPEVLVESGHADIAYAMLAKTTYPSFGFMVERGATTLWENWAERTGSHCHPMYGSVSGWFYRHLAGIGASADGPGFRRIIIRPQVVGDLTSASGLVMTVRGEVAVAWNRTGEGLKMDATIPHGASARIHIPALGLSEPTVVEGERTLWATGRYQEGIEGISSACREGDAVVVEVGGGRYCFDLRAS